MTSGAPITVLIVDDDPLTREQLQNCLEQQRMQVLVAGQMRDALALPALSAVKVALIDRQALKSDSNRELLADFQHRCPSAALVVMANEHDVKALAAEFGSQIFSILRKPISSMHDVTDVVERAAGDVRKNSTSESSPSLYQRVLLHLFRISPQLGTLESAENLLDLVCHAIVESGAFARAAIVIADERFRIGQAGIFQTQGVPESLRLVLRGLAGQPLRPFEFERREERVSSAILTHPQSPTSTESHLIVPLLRNGDAVLGYLTLASAAQDASVSPDFVLLIETFLEHAARQLDAQALQRELLRCTHDLQVRVEDRTRELRLAEERFSRLTNTAADIIYVCDENGRIIFLNESFTRMLGYVRENYVGRALTKLFEEIATDNPANQRVLQVLESSTEDPTPLAIEILTRQGDKRTLEIRRAWIKQAGSLKGTQGIIRDVSEQRALLQQLINCERLAATGRLAAGIAHDINNPLQAMSSQLSTLRKKFISGEDPAGNLDLMQEGVERIRQTVRSLLDLYRGPAPAHVSVNLNDVVQKIAGIVRRELADHGVELTLSLASELPTIGGSPAELQQVLLNLVLNAIEAMPQGGDLLVSTRATQQSVELIVKDNGVGIAPEHLPQIFEPFFTFKPSGTGTGLGLYLTKNIVELHNGRISVESDAGKGSTFTVSFAQR